MINKMISKVAVAAFAIIGFSGASHAVTLKNKPVMKDDACLQVTVGGFFKFAGALVRTKPNSDLVTTNGLAIKRRAGDFFMDAEVIVKGDGETECGHETYKYGAEVQLEANPGDFYQQDRTVTFTSGTVGSTSSLTYVDTIGAGKAAFLNADKVFMYVSNDCFGRVEAGSTDSAITSLFSGAYCASFGTGGIDGIYQDFLGSELLSSPYQPKSHGKALQVYYVTPRWEGVQLATSHAPVVDRRGRFVTRRRTALTDPLTGKLADQNFENAGEYAVNYVNTFCDNFGVVLAAGFSHAHPLHSVRGHEPWRAYGFAAKFTYAGFALSGSCANNGKSGYFKGTTSQPILNNEKERSYTAGLEYECGPYTIGYNYAHMRSAGDTTKAGYNKSDVYAGGATWKAAPGLSLYLEGVAARRKLKDVNNGVAHTNSMALLGSRVDW